LKGFVPENFPTGDRTFEVELAGEVFRFSTSEKGRFDFTCPAAIAADREFQITLRCDRDYNASAAGEGGDQRSLAYRLEAIELSHEPLPLPPEA
jgi:hypothetical protein